jgi:ATP-dependent Clp protease, protease subunit
VSGHLVPTVLEQTSRGERSYDLYSRLLAERIVFLGTEIDDTVANLVIGQLLHLDAEDTERPIALYVNSPGGSVTAGLAIYDTMQYIRSPIATVCVGQAASMAAILLAAGSPDRRAALPHSRVLLHQPSSGAQGQATDIQIAAREVERLRAVNEELLARHTGQDAARIRADLDRDFLLPAPAARDYGIVDEVLASREAPLRQSA